MKLNTILFSVLVLMFVSCSEESQHDIPLESSYAPFNSVMSMSKTLVQEVLVAAYQNSDLTNAQETEASNRSDCPFQQDLNPNEFPKTLIFSYSDGCSTESSNIMAGDLEVHVTDKIGAPGMEIILSPRTNFSINGSRPYLNGINSEFKATYDGNLNSTDSYNLNINGLDVITAEQKVYQIKEMQEGTINFLDVEGNNGNSTSPVNYFDDLAVINFESMNYLNDSNENLTVTVIEPLSFDLFCDCPVAGKVEVQDTNGAIQIIDFSSNANCGGTILVDAEVIQCPG